MKYFQKTCKKRLVLYLVSAVSADGLRHPHALRWPEGIDTIGASDTENMITKQIEWTNSD